MPRPPSNGPVTEGFGWREWTNPPRMHNGEDTIGEGNYAPVTGRVVFAGWLGGLGWAVGIREAANPEVIWWVGHHAWLSVELGEQVSEGRTKLGPIGTTGDSTGVHAHTERRVGGSSAYNSGTATNPRDYYTTSAGSGAIPFPDPVVIEKGNTLRIAHNKDDSAVVGAHFLWGGPSERPKLIEKSTADIYVEAGVPQSELGRDRWRWLWDECNRRHNEFLASIPASGGGAANLQPVLEAIAAGDKKILAAIDQVDEATLAAFGLKRV